MKKLVLAAFLIFILCGGAFEAAAAEYGAPKPARSFGTCTPCTGGIDDSLAPCDDWQYVSGQTGAGGTGDEDKAYTFEAVAGVNYIFSFCESGSGANYDSSLSIWDSACGAVLYACNDDWCGLSPPLSWTAPEPGPYVLRVGGFAGSTGAYTLAYRAVELTCGGLTVSPRESAGFRGLQGGPFEPQGAGSG